jgi:ribosomal protein uL24
MPVIKDDEVKVMRGKFKGQEGRVTDVYRRKYVIHVERCTRDKANGQSIPIGISASNVLITKLKLDKSRKAILERKNRAKIAQGSKGFSDSDNLAGVE